MAEVFSWPLAAPAGTEACVQLARSLDARTIEVVFDRAAVRADAENVANYTVTPTLQIFSAERITDLVYRLRTSRQTQGQLYDLTVSGIGAL